jgi:ATP-dependent DNA helicase RecG
VKSSLQKLYKFFKLEAEHSYDNRAVIGGLERMLAPWEPEARLEGLADELIHAVASRLRDYNRLSPASRRESLDGLWKRIQREAGEPIPDLALPLPLDKLPLAESADTPTGQEKSLPRKAPVPIDPAPQPTPAAVSATLTDADRTAASVAITDADRAAEAGGVKPAAPELAAVKPSIPASTENRPAAVPPPPRRPPVSETPAVALNAPLTVLSGVGPKHASTLARLGLNNLGDMLYNFPRRYDDYSKLKPIRQLWYGEVVTVIGIVQSVNTRYMRGGQSRMVEAIISDGSGALRATWWNPYIAKRIHMGMQVAISGKIEQYLGRLVMSNPELEELDQQNLSTNRIVPIYPLTSQITQRWLRRLMYQVVTYWAPRVQDTLPETIRASAGVMPLPQAILQAHFPDTADLLQSARQRLAFDEIFLLQLGVLRQKSQWQDRTARSFEVTDEWLAAQLSRLPFPLTGAQQHSLADIRADLASGRPMNRLLQGDVGSGKTVIAALAAAITTSAGSQAAIMAPTSILAEQHHKSLTALLAGVLPAEAIRLMIGATPESEKVDIRSGLESGAIKLVVGTHALIEDPVTFADLQLVVIDEQHRFGVEQRAILRSKGQNPHLLVMTATPIPRSLALTLYGDLDLSVMDEMPPGRQPVETQVFYPRERERAYTLLRSQIEQGHQAFIIYPLVEETESGERKDQEAGRSAVEGYARLQKDVFPKYRLGLLHGRLKPDEKDAVMAEYRDGKLNILVSTSVVEVGVDVPNATVMIIEGADRFGLAQLHQFRGRVGRSPAQSFCILIPETPDDAENARLMAMTQTTDGFKLAELDLDQRGPGDFLGTRQAGFSELRMASLTDVRLIEKARRYAQELFERDADLQQPEHVRLVSALNRFWGMEQGDIS